jgi:hypothetical protein
MTEPKDTENTASIFDDKLHKLIKRAGCSGHPSFPNWSSLALT